MMNINDRVVTLGEDELPVDGFRGEDELPVGGFRGEDELPTSGFRS